jgi:hypothetical protein
LATSSGSPSSYGTLQSDDYLLIEVQESEIFITPGYDDHMDVDVAGPQADLPVPPSAHAVATAPSTPPLPAPVQPVQPVQPHTPDNKNGRHDTLGSNMEAARAAVADTAAAASALSTNPVLAPASLPFHDNGIGIHGNAGTLQQYPDTAMTDLGPPMGPDSTYGTAGLEVMAPRQYQTRVQAFARLVFSDGTYYMYTKQIILGRNVELARRDSRRQRKAELRRQRGDDEATDSAVPDKKRRRTDTRPKSVVSQSGGIVHLPYSAMPHEYQPHRHNTLSRPASSSSHPQEDYTQDFPVQQAPNHVLTQGCPEAPDGIDDLAPQDPNDCPLVPIHPQTITGSAGVGGPKAISRQHAKIFYNDEKRLFEIEVLSKQGLYHMDLFRKQGEIIELNHDDTIMIGRVNITFQLPDAPENDDQRTQGGSSSRPMSFSFENGQGEIVSDEWDGESSASEKPSVDPRHLFHMPVHNPYDTEGDTDDREDADISSSPEPRRMKQAPKPKLKLTLKASASRPQAPLPKKDAKQTSRQKIVPNASPDEPTVKKAKKKPKEVEPLPPKQNGKAPAKIPATKEPDAKPAPPEEVVRNPPTPAKAEKPVEPPKSPKLDTPMLARMPNPEARGSAEGTEAEGTITAEMVKTFNLPESLIGYVMEKRKGPGRPPKDGVMSKRQRAQLVKQGKEIEKARAAGIDPADLPIPTVKPKVARPRKDSNANTGEGEEDDIRETTEKGDGTVIAGDKKQAKPTKPPRTPSPEMRMEDYTEEQLQRPNVNYVVLIHEAISSSETGQMNLQQIYTYIERKYPYYKFKTTTSGWQSSVRHNLGQHDAFVKGDKEGKGFNWKINKNVSIEKERRKRQVTPQTTHAPRPGYYPQVNGYNPYAHPGAYYHGIPGHGHSSGAPPPPNEVVQPRLPPSLARNAATATPTSQGPPNPSPYASPWAGGNPNSQHPPRPFPQSNPQGTAPGLAAAPSGQYGVLFPTTAPQAPYGTYATASTYGGQSASTGTTPYSNPPNRTYTPYATAGAQPTPSQPPTATVQAPQQPQNLLARGLGHPAGNDANANAPSGRYPPDANPQLVMQLEVFRNTFLNKSVNRVQSERNVDNAIRAIVYPDENIELTADEQLLVKSIQSIPAVAEMSSGAPKTASDSHVSEAATAASVAANSLPQSAPHPQPAGLASAQAPNTTPAVMPLSAAPTSAPMPTAMPPVMPAQAEPHKFTPTMAAAPSTTHAPPPASPAPLRIATNRPSVEPLTPMVGSPMVGSPVGPNGTSQQVKPVPGQGEQHVITEVGAKEPPKDTRMQDIAREDINKERPAEAGSEQGSKQQQ